MEMHKEIRKARKLLGMTQKQLADLVFVKSNTITQYETGQRMLKTETLEKIIEVLGMKLQLTKTKKTIELNKPKDFFAPKTLEKLKEMSDSNLTDYIMNTQDELYQCLIAYGQRSYYDSYEQMNFHDKWENVYGAIVQMPEDVLEDYLINISIETYKLDNLKYIEKRPTQIITKDFEEKGTAWVYKLNFWEIEIRVLEREDHYYLRGFHDNSMPSNQNTEQTMKNIVHLVKDEIAKEEKLNPNNFIWDENKWVIILKK